MIQDLRRHSRHGRLGSGAVSVLAIGAAAAVQAGDLPLYTEEIYPSVGAIGAPDQPRAMNDLGVAVGGVAVIGGAGSIISPVRWTSVAYELLHPTHEAGRALDINESGVVVGTLPMPTSNAFILDGAGLRALARLGASNVTPLAINDDGVIVGYAEMAQGAGRAVMWIDEEPAELTIDVTIDESIASDVNASGLAVGWAHREGEWSGWRRAIAWHDGTEEWIESPDDGSQSSARAVNDHGVVVGWYRPAGASSDHACAWSRDDATGTWTRTDLSGDLPSSGSQGTAINDAGTIVGTMLFGGDGFVWHDGVGARLDDRLDPSVDAIANCVPVDINDAGEILCDVYHVAAGGGRRAVRLLPQTTSPCPADLDNNGAVGQTDLITLLANWSQPGTGDLDDDGVVALPDLVLLLAAWGPC